MRWAGVRLIRQQLAAFLLPVAQMRVIASVYTGSTEKRAIDDLVGLGAQVRISYDTTQTRLHAKSWLFERALQVRHGLRRVVEPDAIGLGRWA